jgi:hypothetical protein
MPAPLGRSDHRFARANIPMSSLLQSQTIPKYRRYDKTDHRFKGMINLAATAIALK